MAQLNPLIFNEIIEPLIYKNKFKELLELSLISNSVFKIIQNSVTFQSKRLHIILGSIPTLKTYINNNTDESTSNYNLKLIQFKEIQYIKCRFQKDQIFKREEINDYSDHNKVKSSIIEAKEFLNKYCPNLKKVSLIKHVYSIPYSGSQWFDYTMQGFFKFQGLCIDIDDDGLPYSNDEEFDEIQRLEDEDSDGNNDDNDQHIFKDSSLNFQFAFDFISNYSPKKVIVSYCDESSGGYGIGIYGFNNLINYKCIKSLEFENQPTRPEFIKKILSSKHIKSLSLNYCPNEIDYNYISNNNSSNIDNIDFSNDLIGSITQGLINNKTLVKLSFNNWYLDKIKYNNPLGLFQLLEKVSTTTKLNSLDLYGFNIKDSKLLLPLIKLPFISTLYHHFDELNENDDLISLKCYLDHFNENPNIKSFKFTFIYRNKFLKYNQEFVDIFSDFFSTNKSSLEQLTIKFNLYGYDFNLPKVDEIKQKFIDSLQSSNSKLKLTWKYSNLTRKFN